MNARFLGRCALALLPLLPAAGLAQEAFTRQAANVRAGPDRSYPLVAQLGSGAPLRVMGCLDDWSWCDVAFDDNRGWVYAPFLLYDVPGDRVSLYTYGPSLGIAIVGFSLASYWDDHYRQRPWYGGRADWERRAPPPHQAPAGMPPHAAYTPGMHADRGGARPVGQPAAGPSRAAPRAAAAPAHENARASPEHADSQPPREAPRQMQHAPMQQHAPAPQQMPMQQREAKQPQKPPQAHQPAQGRESDAQRGPERGGGEKGGEGKPERETR